MDDRPEPQEEFEQQPMDDVKAEEETPRSQVNPLSKPESALRSEKSEQESMDDEEPVQASLRTGGAPLSQPEPSPSLRLDELESDSIDDEEPEEESPPHSEVAPLSEPEPPVRSDEKIPADLPPVESTVEGPAWYVIHCYSGYENKVRHNLEQRIETMGMKDEIFDVVIPTQEEIEVKDGKRRTVERHIFPGYVLVNMALTEESWYVVRNTPGVTGFVGMGNQPTPLRPEEVSQIVKRMEAEAPTVKVTFKVGERVRIVDGPFNDFRGMVSEIDMERTKVRVMVSFFGRETPVELDFLQVEKA